MSSAFAIETEQLTKRYGDVEAVQAISLSVAANGITGLLGRNGAGKSSTLRMLLGIVRPTSGTGRVLGYQIDDPKQSCNMRKHVAFVGEDKQLYAYMTVLQLIRFTRSFYADWQRDVEERLLNRYQLPATRRVGRLSKGMRTKLALLLALARRPKLLILDEPNEGLDPVAIEELLQALVSAAAEGTTVFYSSHQIAEVERIADRVCLIDQGRLALDAALDEMRREYRRVTVGFAIEPRQIDLSLPGVERVRTSGRQVTVLVSRNVDAVVQRAHQLGAVSVDITPVGLREVFLETVRLEA